MSPFRWFLPKIHSFILLTFAKIGACKNIFARQIDGNISDTEYNSEMFFLGN